MRGLLPEMRQFSEFFAFQPDGVPAHKAQETVDLLSRQTPVSKSLAAQQPRPQSHGL